MPRGPVDVTLLATIIGLVVFGVVMVYSASAVFARDRLGDAQYFLVRQSAYAVVGFVALTGLALFDYRKLRRLTYPLFGAASVLMAAVIAGFGHSVNGATRWLKLGPVNFQPSELAKLALIVWLAHSLSKKNEKIRTFKIGFLPHLIITALLSVLCLLQRDMGSAAVLLFVCFSLLFVAGTRTGYLLGTTVFIVPLGWWLIQGTGYRLARWNAFRAPFEHFRGAGYQLAESLMSFGAGGLTGVGLGDSRQKLLFLPEAHTDFIGAIIGEELGFVGITLLIATYGLLIWRGVRTALHAADDHGTYLAFGVSILFAVQALINLGVAMGELPTKGLTLPFVSFGGSSMVIDLAAAGILLSVSRSAVEPRAQQNSRTPERA
ncbi:MAG: putative lipid II flippase FtsW [Myxococcales bacterium]|nr:putative lipid II flippase FtsW [Myxococcales bacterium]